MLYTLRFFPHQNAVCFIMLTSLDPVLFTFYIQDVLKLKKNSGAKGLIIVQRDAAQSSLFIFLQVHSTVSGVNHTHHEEYTKL